MKKLITVVPLLIAIGFSACSVFQTKKEKNPYADVEKPSEEMAKRAGVSKDTLDLGFSVYMRKCGECHEHMMPHKISSKDWHVIVPGMAWNAGIDPVEEKALLKFLIASRKNANEPQSTLSK